MAVESIGALVDTTPASLRNIGLGQEDFLRILLTQLSFQDPLKPLDNQEFIAQLAQFTSLELNRQGNERMDSLLTIQSATQSVGLIGKTIEVRTDAGSEVGEVTTITFPEGVPNLTVRKSDGSFLTDVRLSQVVIVR